MIAAAFIPEMCVKCRIAEGVNILADDRALCDTCLGDLPPAEVLKLATELDQLVGAHREAATAKEEILLALDDEPREIWTYLIEIPSGLDGTPRNEAIFKALCEELDIDIAPAWREFNPEVAKLSILLTDALEAQDWGYQNAEQTAFYKGAKGWDRIKGLAARLSDEIGDDRTLHLLNNDTPAEVIAEYGNFTAENLADWRIARSRGVI